MRTVIRSAGRCTAGLASAVANTTAAAPALTSSTAICQRRSQWSFGNDSGLDSDIDAMFGKSMNTDDNFAAAPFGAGEMAGQTGSQKGWEGGNAVGRSPVMEMSSIVRFERLTKIPAKFDVLSFSNCYVWRTTAKNARKVVGPMREWATEIKYRTGTHIDADPAFPNKIAQKAYATADDVEIDVYAFGSERSVVNTAKLMESMLTQEPAYVRCGIFRRIPGSEEVEWLTLRRINSDLRPPDVPPISLKTTGTYTLVFENFKEAAIRSAWEESGVTLDPKLVFPSGMLSSEDPDYYWRVPVRYFVAELPAGAEVRAPLPSQTNYLLAWDSRILRQSPDPIDQAWSKLADPSTGTAWLRTSQLDELQKPLRGEHYTTIRYTPPPFSELQSVVNLPPLPTPQV